MKFVSRGQKALKISIDTIKNRLRETVVTNLSFLRKNFYI